MTERQETPLLSASDLLEAHERIRPHIHWTPVLTSRQLDERYGGKLFFKCENLQKVGAFKIRGATNAVFSLPDREIEPGVVTHSSGNHAQALALAARNRGTRATIVMPSNSAQVKVAAVRGYGGEIVFSEPTVQSREETTETILRETGGTLIHPYNDLRIIAGQATAAKELFEQVPSLDIVLAPVGGGGLLSGTSLAARWFSPSTRVVGTEPAGADDAFRSLAEGEIVPSIDPRTIADGLRTSLGDLTFAIIRRHVEKIVTVSEEAIVTAMRLAWERMKIVIEPSAAVPLAALEEKTLDIKDQRVGIILSGGNADLDRLPWQP